MDIEIFYQCDSMGSWVCEVQSSSGNKKYIVRHERTPPNCDYEYDFNCTCPAYQFNPSMYCKHIEGVQDEWCGWHQQWDGGDPVVGEDGEKRCPHCGDTVTAVRCAV